MATGSILEFSPDAGGDVAPLANIADPNTDLYAAQPGPISVDTAGYVYVGDNVHFLWVFAPNSDGNVAPVTFLVSTPEGPLFLCSTGVSAR
jgi:hypothetical protein